MVDDFKHNLKRSAKGSAILAVSQILSTLLLAIGMLVVARILGSTSWGLLSIANSIVTLVQLFQDFGIKDTLTKYISENKQLGKNGNVKKIIESGVVLSLASSVILTFLLILSADYIAVTVYKDSELAQLIKLLSIAIIGRALLFTSYGITEGYERMELRGALRVIYTFFKSILSPFLVLLGYGVLGGVLGEVGPIITTGLIGLFIIFILYRSEPRNDNDLSYRDILLLFLSFGGPLYFANLLTSIRPQLLTFLMGLYVGEEIAGNWTIVLWFSSLISFVYLPIRTTIFPLLSKLTDKKELEFVYKNSIKFATLLTYPIAFTILALSDQIITVLFTNEYSYAPVFLRLYMITFLYTGIGSLSNIPLLNSQKHTKETLKIQIIQFLIPIAPAIFIIPRFGAIGEIILLLIGVGVSKIYAVIKIKHLFGFTIDFSSSLKLFLSGIVSSLVTWGICEIVTINPGIELFLGGFFSLTAYTLLVFLLKALTLKDYKRLHEIAETFGPFSKPVQWVTNLLMKHQNSFVPP